MFINNHIKKVQRRGVRDGEGVESVLQEGDVRPAPGLRGDQWSLQQLPVPAYPRIQAEKQDCYRNNFVHTLTYVQAESYCGPYHVGANLVLLSPSHQGRKIRGFLIFRPSNPMLKNLIF